MDVNIFSRLTDAKPDFSLPKFQMPTDFGNKIKVNRPTVKPLLINSVPITIAPSHAAVKPERFGKGSLTTLIVLGSMAFVLIGTAIIIQKT
ncbi:MAG: hypothetical protein JNJ41_02435 [Bacteroidia bacterium]|nr:hypothetical protein [Bacteroidia bacterium]